MAASLQGIAVSVLWGVLAAITLLAAFLVILVVAGFVVRAQNRERLAWSGVVGVVEAVARPLARFIHRTRWVGFSGFRVPEGGFVIVANHASGLDPPLMQFAVPRPVRFMMAKEQMHPALNWLWTRLGVLPVTSTPADAAMLREAVRHVRSGGVVGVFPEGSIERPPNVLGPFIEGTGTLVALTKAPVVVLWIHGTPTVGNAIVDPFVPRGQAVVEYVGTYDFAALGVREPKEITARLRATLAQASGWPVRDG
ncbi:MAG: lysophospholipid acyltransferase family protein [Phycisphaerales bacterium]